MKGLKEVFVFTLRQQLKIPAVKTLTIVMAVLFFLVPAAAMTLTELSRMGDSSAEPVPEEILPGEPAEEETGDGIEEILYVDSASDPLGYDLLDGAAVPGLEGVRFTKADSVPAANEAAGGREGVLILVLREEGDALEVLGIVPDGSSFDADKAWYAAERTSEALPLLMAEGKGLGDDGKAALSKPFFMDFSGPDPSELMSEEERQNETLRSVAVKPESMIFGKVLAEWTAALIQFGAWVIALVGGFATGTFLVKTINPDSTMGVIKLFEFLGGVTKMFALPEVLVSALIIAAGFFLYCCLAAICASFASKPEELARTFSIFSILLVVSMLVTIRAGFLSGEMAAGAEWYDFFPFTAILITPSRVLLGTVNIWAGLGTLAVILALSVVFILIAGRVYRMMSLYRGKVPKFSQIIEMMKEG